MFVLGPAFRADDDRGTRFASEQVWQIIVALRIGSEDHHWLRRVVQTIQQGGQISAAGVNEVCRDAEFAQLSANLSHVRGFLWKKGKFGNILLAWNVLGIFVYGLIYEQVIFFKRE